MQTFFQEEVQIFLPHLSRKYTFWHISDMHASACFADSSEQEIADDTLGRRWTPSGGKIPLDTFRDILRHAIVEQPDGLILTGDVVDLPSPASNHAIESMLSLLPIPYLYVFGNHESAGKHDCAKYYPLFAPMMQGDPSFSVLEFDDFLLAGIDDSSGHVTAVQHDRLRALASKNKPILLCMHIPMYTDAIAPEVLRIWGPSFLIGTEQSDAETKAFCDFVRTEESHVAAIFCGHIHFAHSGPFAPHRMQYAAAPAFQPFVRRVVLTAESLI